MGICTTPFSSSCVGIPPGLRLMSRRLSTWRASMRCRIGSPTAVSLSPGRVGIWPVEMAASRTCATPSRCSGSRESALYTIALETVLAEVEAEEGQLETANATVDRALAETERTGHRWFEAETHRIRGEILFKRDLANTAPAEEAFLTAIAIAQQQKARSFELRAALSLAKLYQSTGRRRRRPRRPRARARRFFAHAGIPRDRGGSAVD